MQEVDFAALLLRCVLGATLLAHGWNHLFGQGGVQGTTRWFAGLGLRPPALHAWTSGLLEIAAGIGLLGGLATPLWAAVTVGIAVVAGVAAHRPNGFFVFKDGYEYVLMMATAAVALAALGPGRWSLDEQYWSAYDGAMSAMGVFAVGLFGALGLLITCWRPGGQQAAGDSDPADANSITTPGSDVA